MSSEPLRAEWPAPPTIHACTTTRHGGVSVAPYHALNVGDHCGDDPLAVAENRRRVAQALQLPSSPHWLQQVHGTTVIDPTQTPERTADAACTEKRRQVLCVMTADCLPVLLCNRAGSWIAASHAGWRGLCDGVIEHTVARYRGDKCELLVWLGPAIGPQAFEVGDEVRQAFIARDGAAEAAFTPSANGRWLADLFALARQRLHALGIDAVFGGGICTYSAPERFYSYRRDHVTGRMASLIWMD
jgi:YfiH family protein